MVSQRRIPGRNPVRSRLAPGRRVISRGRQTDRVETTTARVLLLSQASPALKALLATANHAEKAETTEETVKSEENLPADAKAAIREMHEDNREEDVPVNPRGRQRGDRRRVRVNLRGRPAGAEEDKPRSSSSNRFRSFPAREGGEGRARGSVVTARPRQVVTTTSLPPSIPTTETLRFQTRPTPASSTESVAAFFQGFDFPAPIPVVRPQAAQAPATPSLQEVTEVPLSVFSLQQTLGAAAGPQAAPVVPQPQQPRAFPAQQFSPQQFSSQPSSEIKPFVHHLPSPPVAAPTQAPAPVSVNRFQPAAAPQSVPASQPQFNSFNLLNTNNFAAFDAQFGGAAPINNGNGVTQLSSNIFAQPGSRLLQGNDVIVNAPSVFGGFGQTNFQSGAFAQQG